MAHTRIKLADHKERKEREGAIDIELSDGSIITIPPPELIPDEAMRPMLAMMSGEISEDAFEFGPNVLGPEAFERFTADGGTSLMLMELIEGEHEQPVGNSSASSAS